MNGITSLNSGAVDLRLSGDQTQRGSYVQRRRAQMAGGGITSLNMPRKHYLFGKFGDWVGDVKDKIVDDIIPNELKNPAVLATLGGIGLNQFGLPDALTQKMGMGSDVGQNWIGELLGGVMPGDTQFNTVLGDTLPFSYQDVTSNPLPGGFDQLAKDVLAKDMVGYFPGQVDPKLAALVGMKDTGGVMGSNILKQLGSGQGTTGGTLGAYLKNQATNALKQKTGLDTVKGLGETLFGDTQRTGQEPFNWKIPVAGGLAAGAYTASQPRDVLPMDETGIKFQTAEAAKADPNLRFKPQEQYTLKDGGRIGYNRGRVVNPGGYAGETAGPLDNKIEGFNEQMLSEYLQGNYPEYEGERVSDYYNRPNFTDVQAVVKIIQMGGSHDDVRKVLGIDITDERIDDFVRWNTEEKAQGGRIGYQEGGIPSVPEQFLEDLKKRDFENLLNDFEKWKKFQERKKDYGPGGQNVAEGGRIGYNRGRVVNPGGYAGQMWEDPEYKGWKKIYETNPELASQHEFHDSHLNTYEDEKHWEKAEEIGGSYWSSLPFRDRTRERGASMVEKLQEYKYGDKSQEDLISDMENMWQEKIDEGYNPGNTGFFNDFGISDKDEIREKVEEGWEEARLSGDTGITTVAQGGRIGAEEGGLMNLGGMEKDYRQEGGFVPIGGQEKADDVPARLSKNEFVFTADAVRNAGGGDIDQGAKVMENLMEHLEAGGEVSEDSQGLEGAQAMYANTQKLQNRII